MFRKLVKGPTEPGLYLVCFELVMVKIRNNGVRRVSNAILMDRVVTTHNQSAVSTVFGRH